jgi:hypothetical protein
MTEHQEKEVKVKMSNKQWKWGRYGNNKVLAKVSNQTDV